MQGGAAMMLIDRSQIRNRPVNKEPIAPLPTALRPAAIVHTGTWSMLEPLDARRHAANLYAASHGSEEALRIWDYLPTGPYDSLESFTNWLRTYPAGADPL